jgi:16S rRNA (adenine1518-N6/adenine1519-N6)-dimethyltransferase
MRARKRFGQHFLHDPAVIDRIARAIDARAGQHLVEIGPGRGALTRRLLQPGEPAAMPVSAGGLPGTTLDAIEIDRDLAALLRSQFEPTPGFTLHAADALEFDFRALAAERGARLRVIGNLPYNISTPLLFHLLASAPAIDDMHVMLQREVVARIAARPGTGDYGRLTVMLAPRVRAERLFDIGPGAFQPAPRVWSAVVRLRVLREPAFAVHPRYAAIVAAAFAHRRKTLRNALRDFLEPGEIEACGIDPQARPETLAPLAFNALAAATQARATPSPAQARIG